MYSEKLLSGLFMKMCEYDNADPKRIQHFVKVHSFAKQIALGENFDDNTRFVLEAASLVHDIGIRKAETLLGRCDGKLQEQYGPAEAEKMLTELGFDSDTVKRVSFLVGHHHTYTNIDSNDYRVLIEADFLVNLYEDGEGLAAIKAAYGKMFRTETAKKLCRDMFGIEGGQ